MLDYGPMRSKLFMNDGQHALPQKKRKRVFRYWLILVGALFLILFALTQFLPGGTRTFSDWLPALFFLLAVSVTTATGLIVVWLLIRPPFDRRKLKRLLLALAAIALLVAVMEIWATWHAWDTRANLATESVLNDQTSQPGLQLP